MYKLNFLKPDLSKNYYSIEIPDEVLHKHTEECGCCMDHLTLFVDSLKGKLVDIEDEVVIVITKNNTKVYQSKRTYPAGYFSDEFAVFDSVHPVLFEFFK